MFIFGGLVFFVVWAFRLFFFCCLGGGVFVFLLFGRVGVFIFSVWAGDVFFFFFAVWAGGVFFCFLLFGRVRVLFLLFGRGSVFVFLLSGPGACFYFAVWAGDGSSLTYPSAWLVFKRPNNKKDRTAKQNTGSKLEEFWA